MHDCMYRYTDWQKMYRMAYTTRFRRKKNQGKGEAVGKRKAKGDEIVREMYVTGDFLQNHLY